MPENRFCETCRWWNEDQVQLMSGSKTGSCRIVAPGRHTHGFPTLLNTDWCGEHDPVDPASPTVPRTLMPDHKPWDRDTHRRSAGGVS